ncbi:MAG TPA: hypothetical protein VFL91_22445, partial [Thermomicrobiales bacterium]|nr:hypothetical protein [Thermomicrobiales bacterium]
VVLQSPTPDLGSVQLTFNADFSGQITFTERSTPPATTARPQLLLGAIGALPLFGLSATPQAGAPPATVDRYIEVDRGGAPSSVVSRAVFQFRAPSSDNGVALQTTGDNGQWRPLATAAKAVDGTQTVYTATSPALYGLYAVTYAAGAAPGLPNTGQGGGIWGGMLWIVPALALAAGLGVALRRFARG